MFNLTLLQAANSWCIYRLIDENGITIFVWYSKLGNALSLPGASSNPNLDVNKQVTFQIISLHPSNYAAQNALGAWQKANGYPPLNLTVRYSHYQPIICHQSGKIYKNQSDAQRSLGISQSALSQHLRRNPGYKTVKGMTFSLVTKKQNETNPAPQHFINPNFPTPPNLSAPTFPIPPVACQVPPALPLYNPANTITPVPPPYPILPNRGASSFFPAPYDSLPVTTSQVSPANVPASLPIVPPTPLALHPVQFSSFPSGHNNTIPPNHDETEGDWEQ